MRTMQGRIAAATDRLRRHAPFLFTLVLLLQLPLLVLAMIAMLVPGAAVLGLLASVAFFLAVPVWNGALLYALGRLSDRGEIDIPEAYRAAMGMYSRLLPVQLLTMLAVFAGFLLLVLPGLYIGLRLALVQCVCVFEGQGGASAFRRSWALTKGREGELLLYFALAVLPLIFMNGLGAAMLGQEPTAAAEALFSFTAQLVSVVCGVVFLVLLQELYRDIAAVDRAAPASEVLLVPVDREERP
jgi:hypothetical protein